MYVIMGATGHTGSVVAERLLAGGQKVRVIGRDAQRLARFTSGGAEPFVADATDPTALAKAFAGADAAYVLNPPNPSAADVPGYMVRVNDAIAEAMAKSKVSHAVVLSSIGADKPDRTGPVVGLHKLEEKLQAIAELQVLFLRAGYFMENLLPQVGVIRSQNMLAGPLRPDLPIGMIATRDIGNAAAQALLDFKGLKGKTSCELQGPREVSYQEVAEIIGVAIGKPELVYRQVPAATLKPILVGMGMSASMADLLLEMSEALNSGYMKPLEARSPLNTGTTTIETFVAEVFVPAYRAQVGQSSARA